MAKDSGAYWRVTIDPEALADPKPIEVEPEQGARGTAGLAKLGGRAVLKTVMIGSILCALVVLLGTGIPALFGFRTMIVTSGSMEPAVHVGDAVVIHAADAESIQPRDVITFSGGPTVGTITHRVLNVREIEGETYFQTQGDANPAPDPDLAPHQAVLGRVQLTLPKMGYFLSFAMSLRGRIALVALPLLILIAQEGRDFAGSLRRPREDDETAPV